MKTEFIESKWIWKNGKFISWKDAKIHVLSLAVQFGSSIFEGIRCYKTPSGPAIFRLEEHIKRLFDSCRIYRIELNLSHNEIKQACCDIVKKNQLDNCYIRPTVIRGYGAAGMNPIGSPVETYIPAWKWGAYLGEEALSQGIDVCVSSWNRPAPNTTPSSAKAGGHYTNSQLIKMEAIANGYSEAIALGPGGVVSEGSGQNLFLVKNNELITPQIDGTSLLGITQDSIIKLAGDLGIAIRKETIPREMLYSADELFFTGTASEVTPIKSVDRIQIGSRSGVGTVTKMVQKRYFDYVQGNINDAYCWLTHIKP